MKKPCQNEKKGKKTNTLWPDSNLFIQKLLQFQAKVDNDCEAYAVCLAVKCELRFLGKSNF